jgi:hypothetical protein
VKIFPRPISVENGFPVYPYPHPIFSNYESSLCDFPAIGRHIGKKFLPELGDEGIMGQ